MRKISFCKMVDFDSAYIAPTTDLPDKDLERPDKNHERHFSIFRRSEQPCNIESQPTEVNSIRFY
jgi:hypothetical protein